MTHQYNEPTAPTQQTYIEQCQRDERDQPHRSALGTGCCQMCGRPIPQDRPWRNGDCLTNGGNYGDHCNVDWAEYDAIVAELERVPF